MENYPSYLYPSESVLAQLSDPNSYPEMFAVREETRSWRFYHHFRTDQNSPLRRPQPGVLTPVLSHDGLDLAAALQTIVEIGLEEDLQESIAFAFNGAKLEVRVEAQDSVSSCTCPAFCGRSKHPNCRMELCGTSA